jgi:outer membrane protein
MSSTRIGWILCFWVLGFGFPVRSFCQEVNVQTSDNRQEAASCLVPTIETAVSQALRFNRQLLTTGEGVARSLDGVDLARAEFDIHIVPHSSVGYVGGGDMGSGLSIGGGVDLNKKFPSGTQITLSPTLFRTCDHYRTEIRALVSQPLLRGLSKEFQLSGILEARFNLRTAYRNLYMAQVQLVLRTIQTLYEVVKAEKSLHLTQASYERVQRFYQAAHLKEKIGLADALDVYQAEIELHRAEDERTSAQERLQEVEDLIRDLLALPLDRCIKVDIPLIYTPHGLEVEATVELALQHRIEMDQSEDLWRENCRLAQLAKKNMYPELNLVLNYSNCGEDEIFTRTWSRHRESTWGIGFTTSTDVTSTAAQIACRQMRVAVEAASRGIDQTRAMVMLDVKKALRQLERTYQRIHLQEKQIKTAEGELYLANLKFNRGMADNFFYVIQAEKSFRMAQQAYWSALIDHIIGEFQLLAAVGLLIDKPQ